MLISRSRNEFEGAGVNLISCTICPKMKTITRATSCSAFELRESLSTILGLDVDSIELYRKGTTGFVSVPDESVGLGHYYVILRLCGGKGGFRKQLEKKGRAFARARRLREANPAGARPRAKQGAELVSSKSAAVKGEISEKNLSVEKEIKPSSTGTSKIRDAVRIGVKRTLDSLICSKT
ncbi:uncharacterized protein Tco025E_00908 [Trypanosoma conorhini]|uniref:Uncharacterized protein n=1 Tax=Trypanosoma conorhini TaxID=83891 RepID=A0A3R7P0G7_9TRYP|nr:uncharacterized protein Tco025E_00908 [Trypanosoma conorhini]RNF26826.1 hypothetical protein Tco025E_00908 [Trypanosoma conorhini]